jgi:rhodanese-related sulfurtransferase
MENTLMRIRIFFIVAMLLASTPAWAQNVPIGNLSAGQVKELIEQPGKALIVDARTEKEYRQAHIRTAVNIPPEQFTSIGKHLPQDKNLPIIFYCRGYS